MAIVQISQITNRKGLQIDLPQLAGAEFGWSVDSRRLFIGNGTLEEGAPVIGNTEILTEFSDILVIDSVYTYKGLAAGYTVQTGPTQGTPVTQSLQSWLDQFATVKDFGAVGDGISDDTAAINRALYQLFCVQNNPQVRRSLFFPAGVYRVTSSILIPPYATLYGEGINNSVISMDNSITDSTLVEYVARTTDNNQDYGVDILTVGSIEPQYITISNMGFQNQDPTTNVFLVEDATNCRFQNVSFQGSTPEANLDNDTANTAGVSFSIINVAPEQIVFDGCSFSGATYGITDTVESNGITVSNSNFNTLWQGVFLDNAVSGVRIVNNLFDNIFASGIYIGASSLNATAQNIFYDVGNEFLGAGNPVYPIIEFTDSNNISVSDMFERDNTDAAIVPRIEINNTTSIAFTNGDQLQMGSFNRLSGLVDTLVAGTTATLYSSPSTLSSFNFNYTISRDNNIRNGTIAISNYTGIGLTYSDDYVQNSNTDITLSVTQSSGVVSVAYTATAGNDGSISYSINYIE